MNIDDIFGIEKVLDNNILICNSDSLDKKSVKRYYYRT